MKPTARGVFPDIQDAGYLCRRELLDVAKGNDEAVVKRQPVEGSANHPFAFCPVRQFLRLPGFVAPYVHPVCEAGLEPVDVFSDQGIVPLRRAERRSRTLDADGVEPRRTSRSGCVEAEACSRSSDASRSISKA